MNISKVAWLLGAESVASYRYMAQIARALGSRVCQIDENSALPENTTAVVVGKPLHPGFNRLAMEAKAAGIPVLAYMCDWHFSDPRVIAQNSIADLIVVQTQAMARNVRKHWGREPIIIEEPLEGPRGRVRFAPSSRVKVLWFGSPANFDTIPIGVSQIGQCKDLDVMLHIMANDPRPVLASLNQLEKPKARMSVEMVPWSLERQWKELERCDVVMLPSFDRPDKVVKGHNRLLETINAGRLALAFPLPQYRELASFCCCNEDLGRGLIWALENPLEVVRMISAGQSELDTRFSLASVAARWRDVLDGASLIAAN